MFVFALINLTAVVCASLWARRTQRRLPLSRIARWGIGLGAFCGAMIGAKLPFLFTDWQRLLSGAAWFDNGKTILMGLAGGYVGVELAKWVLQVRTRTGDTFVVPACIAIGIGRLGCFHAGCCYGVPTSCPWGVVFAQVDAVPRHPTQLYESCFHGAFAILSTVLQRWGWWQTHHFKAYIVVYSIYRFVTEFIRPEPRAFAGWTIYQWASIFLVVVFGGLWWWESTGLDSRLPRELE